MFKLNYLKKNKLSILIAILLLLLILVEARGQGDFDIFLQASKDLFDKKNIYQIQYHDWYHYYYDTLFAIIIAPLNILSLYWATFIWLLLNVFFTFRTWKIILSYLPTDLLNKKQIQMLTLISFAFIFTLWHKNIHLSQMTIFILYLCLEGLFQIKNQKLIIGSLIIALGISIKILPIVLIPYLLYRGNFKAAAFVFLGVVLILFLPGIFIGFQYNTFLLQERWTLINPLNEQHFLDVSERSFHSLTAVLTVLFIEDAGNANDLDLKRNIANVSLETLKLLINIVRLAFVSFSLYFINSLPFKRSKSDLHALYEISYILLIVPLIFPHQQHYAFFFAFPALTYLVFYFQIQYFSKEIGISKFKKLSIIIFAVLIFFLLNSDTILGAYRNFYYHFKTLTYGILMLIPVLAFCRPKKMVSLKL